MKRLTLLLGILLTSCTGQLGPQSIRLDGLKYNKAVQTTLDQQMLINIVRLRYRDTPQFLQIGVVSSAYEYKRGGKLPFKFQSDSPNFTVSPEFSVELNEKPTTTYTPLRGDAFVREMLTPITLANIKFLHTSGWNIQRILRCCVQRMNGVKNALGASGPTPDTVPDYQKFLELAQVFQDLEDADSIAIVARKHPNQDPPIQFAIVLDPKTARQDALKRFWKLLDLEQGTTTARLVPFAGIVHGPDEINIETRSPMSLLYFLSQGVIAPERDVLSGRVTTTQDPMGGRFDWDRVLKGLMKVHSSCCDASDAGVNICYRGTRFFIDDRDLDSKATFSMLTQLLPLQAGPNTTPYYLTLPLNN